MTEDRPPAALLQSVARNLRPVRPLFPPWGRALLLLPLGLALVVGAPLFWGWRSNLADLGLAAAWGLSALEVLAGLLIVGAALREAVPGRELSASAVAATTAVAAIVFVGTTLATARVAPFPVPVGVFWRWTWECLGMAAVPSLPALAASAWLASRALPNRPAVAGALYGLGAGLVADAGVRLFCQVSAPSHVFVSHGLAIGALVVLGAAAATVIERTKRA
jgi:hypothetical protein